MIGLTAPARTRSDDARGTDRGPLVALGSFLALFALSVAVPSLAGAGTMPPPGSSTADFRQWADHHIAVISSGALMVAAAAALTGAGVYLARRLAVVAPSACGPRLVRISSAAAATTLAACGVCVGVLGARSTSLSADTMETLGRAAFALGGPVHTLLLGGVVLGWALVLDRAGTGRRAAIVLGTLAGLDLIGAAALFSDELIVLVPIGRFPTMLGLVVGSVRWLPRRES
ncbi:hypothetical protein ABZV91_16510 [Nocardia sp. NPDC004568]|uniref:hypothetical protein n=1 Tax=Nocardia sp. NPDC004568 TaxID=3154551 RepID=UPI00339F7465